MFVKAGVANLNASARKLTDGDQNKMTTFYLGCLFLGVGLGLTIGSLWNIFTETDDGQ